MLGAVGGKKQELRHRVNVFFGFEKGFAQTATERCSAGLQGGQNIKSPDAQIPRK
jgi:hypothetical protein